MNTNKDVYLQVRVSAELRTIFYQASQVTNKVPSELIREFMKQYIKDTNEKLSKPFTTIGD